MSTGLVIALTSFTTIGVVFGLALARAATRGDRQGRRDHDKRGNPK